MEIPPGSHQSNPCSTQSSSPHWQTKRFERILTVPHPLQDHLLRWTGEFDACDRAANLGNALDTVTAFYQQLIVQFTRTADVRVRCIEAPTPFMVVPMYYCDKGLDAILHAIATIRRQINVLYSELRVVKDLCQSRHTVAQTLYKELEGSKDGERGPGMMSMISSSKARAAIFEALAERIESILRGGNSMFLYLNKSWCHDNPALKSFSAFDATQGSNHTGNGHSELLATPDEEGNVLDLRNAAGPSRHDAVEKTPEMKRCMENEIPVTQASSPRRKRANVVSAGLELSQGSRGVPINERRMEPEAESRRAVLTQKSVESIDTCGKDQDGEDELVRKELVREFEGKQLAFVAAMKRSKIVEDDH